jgi:putative transcriptional regulator
MAVYNRLKILIAEKEFREKRKLTYRIIAKETGISKATLTLYMSQKADRVDLNTVSTLCEYFECQPGDLLIYSNNPPTPKKKK